MKKLIYLISLFFLYFVNAQEKAVPYFKNGEAQVVEAFKDESTNSTITAKAAADPQAA